MKSRIKEADEALRQGKEAVIKAKLGNKAEDVDLSSVPDEELDKMITDEDKKEVLKKRSGVENLNVDNLSSEELDTLMSKLGKSEDIGELVECMTSVGSSENDILEAIKVHTGMKLQEAKNVYTDVLREIKMKERV
jgi:hypothetical protein